MEVASQWSTLIENAARGPAILFTTVSTLTPTDLLSPEQNYRADLSFLGNRLPDREARVDEFFFRAASVLSSQNFSFGRQWVGRQGQNPKRQLPRPSLLFGSQCL